MQRRGAPRRHPTSPSFDRDVTRLIELEKIIDEAELEYDKLIIKVLVDDHGPNARVAERMGVPQQTVSYRRRMALTREARRATAT